MKTICDLSTLEWTLCGYTPYLWEFEKSFAIMGPISSVDIGPIPVKVPGSVQQALLDAGIIRDWNVGVRSRDCEWIENRHWIFRTRLPDEWIREGTALKRAFQLACFGLDYSGWIYVNGQQVSAFKGTHVPHVFDISDFLNESDNALEIIFDLPPRWLGMCGYSSKWTEWKPRYNYTWDWVPRLVQIGIWDAISLVATDGNEFVSFRCLTNVNYEHSTVIIHLDGEVGGSQPQTVKCVLSHGGSVIHEERITVQQFEAGWETDAIPIELWWPNLEGSQPLYDLTCVLLDESDQAIDTIERTIGFKHVAWKPCVGAPAEADPWVCEVNGRPIFLQGVNFAPIRAHFADLTREDYEKRLVWYKDLGCNMLRINACGFLEFAWFYELCDELGIMVWQDFPLTSSGIENWPPEDESQISIAESIAESFIERRQHHVSLTMWAGGNELMGDLEGNKSGLGKPCSPDHPMLSRLKAVVENRDPGRRYVHASPSGPRAWGTAEDFGKGLHWDVHGPYPHFADEAAALDYWSRDDALFRSELSCPGANPIELMQRYKGDFEAFPATPDNPYWSRPTSWWIDWKKVCAELGREPENLPEYVEWSQKAQAEALSLGMKMCKARFPGCGGVLLWGSHDTFPQPINTSIMDFDGNPKPAAFALAEVWRNKTGQ